MVLPQARDDSQRSEFREALGEANSIKHQGPSVRGEGWGLWMSRQCPQQPVSVATPITPWCLVNTHR